MIIEILIFIGFAIVWMTVGQISIIGFACVNWFVEDRYSEDLTVKRITSDMEILFPLLLLGPIATLGLMVFTILLFAYKLFEKIPKIKPNIVIFKRRNRKK